jgi:hypothetical protein
MKTHILSTLVALAVSMMTATAQSNDPLPNVKLPAGQIKKLGADFIMELVGTGINLAVNYLTDYSNAGFQLEKAFWSEGKSHLYENMDVQVFRRIDWINPSSANYMTERLLIDRTTGIRELSAPELTPFSDYETARRSWRSFFYDGTSYTRIVAWRMQIQHRIRNTYYKAAKFASKQMDFPVSVRVYADLQRLPSVEINGQNHNFRPGYDSDFIDVEVGAKNGVSRNFTLITRNNRKLFCSKVPELWVPGKDDQGSGGTNCN